MYSINTPEWYKDNITTIKKDIQEYMPEKGAWFSMGVCYQEGYGVEQSYFNAMECYLSERKHGDKDGIEHYIDLLFDRMELHDNIRPRILSGLYNMFDRYGHPYKFHKLFLSFMLADTIDELGVSFRSQWTKMGNSACSSCGHRWEN